LENLAEQGILNCEKTYFSNAVVTTADSLTKCGTFSLMGGVYVVVDVDAV